MDSISFSTASSNASILVGPRLLPLLRAPTRWADICTRCTRSPASTLFVVTKLGVRRRHVRARGGLLKCGNAHRRKRPFSFLPLYPTAPARTQPAPACDPAPACPPPSVSSALHPRSIHFTAHVARHSPSLLTFPHRISFPRRTNNSAAVSSSQLRTLPRPLRPAPRARVLFAVSSFSSCCPLFCPHTPRRPHPSPR